MARDSCLARVTAGVAIGGAVGGAVDAKITNKAELPCLMAPVVIAQGELFAGTNKKPADCTMLCAVYGTYEAIRFKVPGLLKIRYIGRTTLGSAAVFGLFLGAGSLIHCGKSY